MITKDGARKLRAQLEVYCKEISEQLGMDVKLGNASYNANSITFKLELAEIDDSGEVLSKEVTRFKLQADLYHLKPEDLFKQFHANGRTYTVKGLDTRSYKYPILCYCEEDGKTYKFPGGQVRHLLDICPAKT